MDLHRLVVPDHAGQAHEYPMDARNCWEETIEEMARNPYYRRGASRSDEPGAGARSSMGESSNDSRRHRMPAEQGPLHRAAHEHTVPYWQRAHRDWRFWVAVVFIFAALFVFIMSDNLALIPRG